MSYFCNLSLKIYKCLSNVVNHRQISIFNYLTLIFCLIARKNLGIQHLLLFLLPGGNFDCKFLLLGLDSVEYFRFARFGATFPAVANSLFGPIFLAEKFKLSTLL